MSCPPPRCSRRRFLEGGSSLGILAALPGSALGAPPHSPELLGQRRETLVEPGPMLPPSPAILLTVNGRDGDPDEISVVWTFVINGKPPQIGIAPAHEHVARELVAINGEFTLNVPTAEIVQAFDRVDMSSSRVADKFALSGLTPGRAASIDAPTVVEAPIQLECRVFDRIEVPPVRTVFLAGVVATSVLEGTCDDDGRLRVGAVELFGMSAGSGEFWTLGQRVGHIGMTAGRDDIKY